MALRFEVCDHSCPFEDFCFLLFRTEWSWWFCHFQILFSVFFKILKNIQRPEIRTPNTWCLKTGTPKTRTPNAETRKTRTQKLGCGILRDAWFSQSEISNQWCLRLFKNVSKKVLLYENWNPVQNIWHKVTKYSKIGQDFKNVISDFACFLTAIANV